MACARRDVHGGGPGPATPYPAKACLLPFAALQAPTGLQDEFRSLQFQAPSKLATLQELSSFLVQTERRAYKQALFAVRDRHMALDIVQDAMLRLTEKYGSRPVEELPLVFQRILQNAIRDHFRRYKVRSLWTTLFTALMPSRDGDFDPLETLEPEPGSKQAEGPPELLQRSQTLGLIEEALEALPARQRQAFLLRYWEELDVRETAQAMGCSEGSVKTHCSRASQSLAQFLKSRGIEL